MPSPQGHIKEWGRWHGAVESISDDLIIQFHFDTHGGEALIAEAQKKSLPMPVPVGTSA